jgi:hypothetical protein
LSHRLIALLTVLTAVLLASLAGVGHTQVHEGVYTLWNVVETEPFKDEPYTEFGAGKHAIVADGSGRAHKVVQRDSWPGKEFLLDYHADGKLSQAAGVYPGALWGKFPASPER